MNIEEHKVDVKTCMGEKELIYSNSVLIKKDNNKISIKTDFDLTIVFNTEIRKNEEGEIKTGIKASLSDDADEGLNIEVFNSFYMEGSIIESAENGFCQIIKRINQKTYEEKYHLSMITHSVAAKNNYAVANINIFKETKEKK